MKFSLTFERSKPEPEAKAVVATATTREGWSAYGIPADSGDGFAYNRDWVLGCRAGGPLSEFAILQLSAAMACVRLLSQTIATLPISIFRRTGDGGRKLATDHQLYELLHNQPNADMTAVDFWQVVVASMLLRGNAIVEKTYFADRLVSLDPIHPDRVTWIKNKQGGYDYWVTDGTKRRQVPTKDIWHIPAFTLDGVIGLSPICFGANVFSGAISADEASASVFRNGMNASGFVQSPNWLKEAQRDQIRESLAGFSGRSNSGKSMVLEGGMTYTQLSMNPEDAQMLETRQFNIEEICRWYGVPPTLIGHGDKTSNWGTGLEQQNIAFLTYSLRAWLSKIEQSIRKNLLTAGEKGRYFAEFAIEGLLRADSTGRAAWYRTMTDIGAMTRDEVRVKENLEQKGGNADILTVQSALVPLDKLGEKPPTPPPAIVEDPVKRTDASVVINVADRKVHAMHIVRDAQGNVTATPIEES